MNTNIKTINGIIRELNRIKEVTAKTDNYAIYSEFAGWIFNKLENLQSKYYNIMKSLGCDFDDIYENKAYRRFHHLITIAEEDTPMLANKKYFSISTFLKVIDELIADMEKLAKSLS